MSNDLTRRPQSAPEVLPPRRNDLPVLSENDATKMRRALYTRLKLWGRERVVNGLVKVYEAELRAFDAAAGRNDARIRYERTLVNLDAIEEFREDERAEIHHQLAQNKMRRQREMAQAQDEYDAALDEIRREKIRRQIEQLKAELDLDREYKRLEPKEQKNPLRERMDQALNDANQISELEEEFFRREGVKSEEELSPAAQQILRQAKNDIAMKNVKA